MRLPTDRWSTSMGDPKKPENESTDESNLFREAMQDVRPLHDDSVDLRPEPPKPIPKHSMADDSAVMSELDAGDFDPATFELGDEHYYQQPNLPRTVVRKLRRGQIALQGELDLHGRTIPEAKQALSEFLNYCSSRGFSCVRIIHGKGHGSPGKVPRLKPQVARWLARRDDVLAYSPARNDDGGTGALYVLLRY